MRDAIIAIVDEHSGGVKGIELVTGLMARGCVAPMDGAQLMDEIEKEVARIPELGILKYAAKIDESLLREKIFVYRRGDVAPSHQCGSAASGSLNP